MTETNQDTPDRRPSYQAPVLIEIGNVPSGEGVCRLGGSPTNRCAAGSTFVVACTNGNRNVGACASGGRF